MSRNTSGWGSWHTGPAAPGPCPQDQAFHSEAEACSLNEKDSEYRRAKAWARHKEWVGAPGVARRETGEVTTTQGSADARGGRRVLT